MNPYQRLSSIFGKVIWQTSPIFSVTCYNLKPPRKKSLNYTCQSLRNPRLHSDQHSITGTLPAVYSVPLYRPELHSTFASLVFETSSYICSVWAIVKFAGDLSNRFHPPPDLLAASLSAMTTLLRKLFCHERFDSPQATDALYEYSGSTPSNKPSAPHHQERRRRTRRPIVIVLQTCDCRCHARCTSERLQRSSVIRETSVPELDGTRNTTQCSQ